MYGLKIIILFFMLLLTSGQAWSETLASVATKYVIENYTIEESQKEIYFDLNQLQEFEGFAVLNSPVYHVDGSESASHIEDLVFVFCLKQSKVDRWRIVYDLSRSDVPSPEELQEIRNSFPGNFPHKLLPIFWQQQLK